MFAGGGEELDWTLSVLFDAMGAMSSDFNDTAGESHRAPMTRDRDGFVIAGGAGVVVLEELEHAKARGASIYGELVGYGATSDGYDMVQPSGEGAVRCMRARHAGRRRHRLHQSARHLDADRRRQGDRGDPRGVRRQVAADQRHQVAHRPFARRRRRAGGDLFAVDDEQRLHLRDPPISRPSIPPLADMPIVRKRQDNVDIDCVMSNSFGFGGTNATLVFRRYNG